MVRQVLYYEGMLTWLFSDMMCGLQMIAFSFLRRLTFSKKNPFFFGM